MDTAILPSTFLLTLLLSVGLFFFIRAATKDRTETVQLLSEQEETALMTKLKEYFRSRSYRVVGLDQEKNQVIFEGFVQPSWFLAIFLSFLAFIGLVCLSLVLSMLFPDYSQLLIVLVLLSPLSGWFYWQKAGRLEKVSLQIKADPSEQPPLTKLTVTAHRDELIELRRALQFKTDE
jgi:type IV secretory pathway VirB3-like protein